MSSLTHHQQTLAVSFALEHGCPLQLRQDVVHAGAGRVVVASWIVRSGGHVDALDDTAVDDHGKALAAQAAQD